MRPVQPQVLEHSRQRLHGLSDQVERHSAWFVAVNLDAVLELEHVRMPKLRARVRGTQRGHLQRAVQARALDAAGISVLRRAHAPCAGA